MEPLVCSSLVSSRLAAIFLALAAPYILLSVSYEVLFLMTLTVTLHQWLQVEVGQLTWASQSLTQVSREWCNHSNQRYLDHDLAPVATGEGQTADLDLQFFAQVNSVWCNYSNQGDLDSDLAPMAAGGTWTADLDLPVSYTGEQCMV